MSKERLAAFVDAVLAIVMTIVVLEFAEPTELSWEALWAMRSRLAAYAVSFFWLGAMWVNMHNYWHFVDRVGKRTVWHALVVLFFSSLIPWVTVMVSDNFDNVVAQVCYGAVVLAVTFANMAFYRSTERVNHVVPQLSHRQWFHRPMMAADLAIKAAGLAVCVTVWPPAMFWSVLVSLLAIIVPPQLRECVDDEG